jgi:hypothetical protein
MAAWATLTVFFFDNATLWTVTPAESRQWNQVCIVMNFYDKHVWHLLSAPALYLPFMFLLCLDDDLVDKKRKDIIVFQINKLFFKIIFGLFICDKKRVISFA